MMCIPILRYTHIRNMADSVCVDVFEKQINYLQKKGYYFLSLDELFEIKNREISHKRCVLLTFDGAWRDVYECAYPILKHYWVKAGLFIVTEWVDEASKMECEYQPTLDSECQSVIMENPRAVMCNWEEVKAMQDVFSIGSMTHTYQSTNIVSLSWQEDFELSKKLIKSHLGVETKHLAWPNGEYNQNLIRTAKALGYEAFYTLKNGLNRVNENNDELKRYAAQNRLFWLKKTVFATTSTRNFSIGKIFL